ncbi:MAG: hypothetical protein RL685_1103 [Pseudomonadota bacterium]
MRPRLTALVALMGLYGADAWAAEAVGAPAAGLPRLGIAPGEPQSRSALPSLPFGVAPGTSTGFVLDFHGYLLMPLTLGFNERPEPLPGQGKTVIHNPPLIPLNSRSFSHTGVVPTAYGQLNFTYGNQLLSATLILAAENFTDATGLYNPVEQLGARDAFLSLNLSEQVGTPFELRVGAYTGRYGVMGSYDLGRYGTPLIARTNTIGESTTLGVKLNETLTLIAEQGLGGQLGKPNANTVSSQYNDYAFTEAGATFVGHAHVGLDVARLLQLGVHYFYAWTRDDTAGTGLQPDGSIGVFGADARLMAGQYGHLYAGFGLTSLTNARTVSGAIEVLNARGGPELMAQYLGGEASNGDGSLKTLGLQYDLSVSRLLYGERFQGLSPDILVSLFGVHTRVSSDAPEADGDTKLKLGAEVTYNAFSWFSVSGRFDHVAPGDSAAESFNVLSPRLLFHNGWDSQMEIALAYSHFVYGSNVVIETGSPPTPSPQTVPDGDVLSLTGWLWW